jgi:glycerol-3-phosphate dehydrogenase (NAD(P)+)
MAKVGVIGGGAFGTAMACVLARSGHEPLVWAREPEVVAWINGDGINPLFLSGVRLVPGILATNDLAAATREKAFIVIAVAAAASVTATSAESTLSSPSASTAVSAYW